MGSRTPCDVLRPIPPAAYDQRVVRDPLGHGSLRGAPECRHLISYVILPCFCDREMRSPAYSPASTNSAHDARTASLSLGLTSNAFSHARGTRLSRSA